MFFLVCAVCFIRCVLRACSRRMSLADDGSPEWCAALGRFGEGGDSSGDERGNGLMDDVETQILSGTMYEDPDADMANPSPGDTPATCGVCQAVLLDAAVLPMMRQSYL